MIKLSYNRKKLPVARIILYLVLLALLLLFLFNIRNLQKWLELFFAG